MPFEFLKQLMHRPPKERAAFSIAVAMLVTPTLTAASADSSSQNAITNFSHSTGASRQDGSSYLAKHHLLPCTKEDEDVNFPVFSVGKAFEGLQLKRLHRYCTGLNPLIGETRLPLHANYLSFNYGDCPAGQKSCRVPLGVQNWPACEGAIPDVPHRDIMIRGVPGALYDEDTRLEIYTGVTKVVIYGNSRGQIIRAGHSIRRASANPWRDPEQTAARHERGFLEPPSVGALEGTLNCDEVAPNGSWEGSSLKVPQQDCDVAVCYPAAEYMMHEGCDWYDNGFADPINVIWQDNDDVGQWVRSDLAGVLGWRAHSVSFNKDYFWNVDSNGSHCRRQNGQLASKTGISQWKSRFHLRWRALTGLDNTNHHDAIAGAHHEDHTLFQCGVDHAVDKGTFRHPEPNGSGFDRGRTEVAVKMIWAGYNLGMDFHGNTGEFTECDGDVAGSDGYAAYFDVSHTRNAPSEGRAKGKSITLSSPKQENSQSLSHYGPGRADYLGCADAERSWPWDDLAWSEWNPCYDLGADGLAGGWDYLVHGSNPPDYAHGVQSCNSERGLCIATKAATYYGGDNYGEYVLNAPTGTYFTKVRFAGRYYERQRNGNWPKQCFRLALYQGDNGVDYDDGYNNHDVTFNKILRASDSVPQPTTAVFRLHNCGAQGNQNLQAWDAWGRLDTIEAVLSDTTAPTVTASGDLFNDAGHAVKWGDQIPVTVTSEDTGSGLDDVNICADDCAASSLESSLGADGEGSYGEYYGVSCDYTHDTKIQPCGTYGSVTRNFDTSQLPKGWNDICAYAQDYAGNVNDEPFCRGGQRKGAAPNDNPWSVQLDGQPPGSPPVSVETGNNYAQASWAGGVGDLDGSQAEDPGAGLEAYEYRYQINGGNWTNWARTADHKAPILTGLATTDKVTYQVRTVDNVGNVSADADIQESTATAQAQPVLGKHPFESYATGGERFLANDLTTNLKQGSLLIQRSDLTIPSKGPGLTFTRTYNSAQNKRGGILGYGWRSATETHLTELPDQSVLYDDGQGAIFRFYSNGQGGYNHIPGLHVALAKSGGTFTLLDNHHNTQGFDQEGKLASLSDRNQNTLTYTYNDQDQLTTITDAAGRQTTLAYDINGRLATVTDPSQRVTNYTYTADNLLRSVIDPAGDETCFAYDSQERLARTATPDLVDDVGCAAIAADDEGTAKGEAVITYDTQGRVSTLTNEEHWQDGTQYGASTIYTYACRGNASRICVRSPSSDTYSAEYVLNAAGQVTSQKDEGARTITKTYNGDYHPTKITTDAGGRNAVTTMGWTPNGELAWRKEPGRTQPTNYTYRNDDLVQLTSPLGVKTTYTYDGNHNLDVVTKGAQTPDALTTDYDYDSSGNLTALTDALGKTTHLAYDDDGNLTSVTDPGNVSPALSFTYDAIGERTSATDASGNSSTLGWLDNGRLEQQTDTRAGGQTAQTANLTYNKTGDLTDQQDEATDPQGAATHANQTSVLDPFIEHSSFAVGEDDNQQTPLESHSPKGLSTVRTQTRVTHEGNTDVVGRPYDFIYHNTSALLEAREQETDDVAALYTYDGDWNITRNDRDADGATVASTFAANTDIETRRQAASGREIYFDHSYTTNNDDQLTQVVDRQGGPNTSYTYTASGKLKSETEGSATTTYTYDAAGQRTRKQAPEGTTNYTYNDQGQLSQEQGPNGAKTYGYDEDGNLRSVAGPDGTTSYGYDSQSRLTHASLADGSSADFTYQDQTNLRLSKKVYDRFGRLSSFTQYVYDPTQQNLIAELDAKRTTPAVKAVYNRGPLGEPISVTVGPDTASATYYYNVTPKGHVVALSNSFGDTSPGATYSYDAFGNPVTDGEDIDDNYKNPLRFRGAIYDKETGLYYLKNRYYDPRSGLYISPDPGRTLLPLADRYAYAQGDPVNISEPDGTALTEQTDDAAPFERPLARGYKPLGAMSTLSAQDLPTLGCTAGSYPKTPTRRDLVLTIDPSQSDLLLADHGGQTRPCESG